MTKTVDISSFNSVEVANKGEDFELFFQGKSTGIKLHVLGSDSDAVREFSKESLKDYARKSKFAQSKGSEKEIAFQLAIIDKLEERTIETALVRIVGWSGQDGAYDEAKMRIALKNNPQWVDEVIEFSNSLGK
jgi:hypothetical protein